MFERNRIERQPESDRASANVEITLEDGSQLSGKVYHSPTRSLGEEINSPTAFLDFEPHGRERIFVLKQSIRVIKTTPIPRADQLNRSIRQAETFSPHSVLKVSESASRDEVREAYHRLVKIYHPDRFATAELPSEVSDYINAMVRRINVAYSALLGGETVAKGGGAGAGAGTGPR